MKERLSSEEEKRLLAACILGDQNARHEFVDQYLKLVYYTIYKTLDWMRSSLDQDVVQELRQRVFLALFDEGAKKLRQFGWKRICSLASWIRLITKNVTLDYLEKEAISARRTVSIDEELNPETKETLADRLVDRALDALSQLTKEEQTQLVIQVVRTLDPTDQAFVYYRFYEGASYKQMAHFMGKGLDALYMQWTRIKDQLERLIRNRVSF